MTDLPTGPVTDLPTNAVTGASTTGAPKHTIGPVPRTWSC